ncbi:PEP motif putative anchor domain protein [Alkalidesulfovibrio alkalitolerans DSM 16529]|uniref:PEP motif putative anchor domain protein n=1 Tax=Alkalidesulfovibrio alkalitolerans DSM 16529 TaxID=1121439 RepID=S7T1Z4_9BACT|nr:PEP-CTERM sorting domain-containing protein [Alkalidesulfovibrio alkalitolerans]EPR30540.1 PEP motif putative anchor domain protein [Alkalidesulfovibrio alkalitolerans DSM 16529]
MKKAVFLFALLSCMLFAPNARADFVFGDGTIHWPGFPSQNAKYGAEQNSKDVWGTPDILGGVFTFDGHYLTGIQIDYKYPTQSGWDAFAPADWFFDVNADGTWDYVITSQERLTDYATARQPGDWAVYGVSLDFADPGSYYFSVAPSGFLPRYDHPVKADLGDSELLGYAEFSGWRNSKPNTSTTYTALWDLSNSPIFFGGNGGEFIYGFALTCANDVLYGTGPVPTPEPGTMLLLLGGAGAMFARRLRKMS